MAKNSIVPVIILLLVVFLFAVIGFVVYTIVQDISNKTKAKMHKKNIQFSKDGMKVSMKEVRDEDYKDQTQRFVSPYKYELVKGGWADWLWLGSVLVKVWNNSSFPAYKSRLWDNGASPAKDKESAKRYVPFLFFSFRGY